MRQSLPLVVALISLVVVPARAIQMSDADIAERVSQAVLTYPQFSIFDDVEIGVNDRAVTLTGRVTMPVKRNEIGKRVAKIDGVRSVTNDIGVLPESQTDAALRVRVARAIYNHPAFWRYAQMTNPPIHIIVEGGRITLTGVVDSEVDRMLANSLAQVGGSFGVTNRLKLDTH
ncbi:MAG TPA: BON domain-containing protein [Vicinamibacterales bacterium]|jgi:hyperosmotically inducible protein|nr:BON domain-containing protein [Vicinamibacterales bacterium]